MEKQTGSHGVAGGPSTAATRMAAVAIVLLGFVPLAALVPTDLEIPGLAGQLRDWASGSALAAGIAALAWFTSSRGHWPTIDSKTDRLKEQARLVSRRLVLLVACCSLLLYGFVASAVFSRRPLLIDELAQLWQAQQYADGRLWLPVPAHREFFSFLHLVDIGDRVYSQFPPGGPFMLSLGLLVGVPWLVGPACGAMSVLLFSRLARAAEPTAGERWTTAATLLFAVTPFAVFMFSSHMNHTTALFWILAAIVALIRLTVQADNSASGRQGAGSREGASWTPALFVGFCLGVAATIRPLDAFAFALPAAVWLIARAGRSPHRWAENFMAAAGVAIPFAVMLYVNAQTTGHPLRFGYEVLWGDTHGLGFHAAPWGQPHTPLRGLALASLYQWRLQSYLFETPFPSLALPVVALWFTRQLDALDRYLLASGALVILLYLLYWHDGFYLGPRFVVPLLPVMVLWTARLPLIARRHLRTVHAQRAMAAVLVFGAAGALVFNLPVRVAQYRAGLTSMRVDYSQAAEAAGVRHSLVFVRESWGAQLVARLWALGITRPMAELTYRGSDSCHLEQELSSLERGGIRGAEAERRLASVLARDSAFVVRSTLTPDPTERMRDGVHYPLTCLRRIADDRMGFLHYAPLRLVRTGNNVYARDLHARDSLMLMEHPERPVYLLTRAGTRVDDPLRFMKLDRDSLRSAWRAVR